MKLSITVGKEFLSSFLRFPLFAAAVGEHEAKERGSSLIGRSIFLQNARDCGQIRKDRNCGYAW